MEEKNAWIPSKWAARVPWLMLASALVVGVQCRAKTKEERVATHASSLARGDIEVMGPEYTAEERLWYAAVPVPYHLVRLIQLAPDSCPALVDLLYNEMRVDVYYWDVLSFLPYSTGPYTERHQATVADLADYGLGAIYDRDVGFRSYLPEVARERAIKQWREIVTEHSQDKTRDSSR